MHSLSVFTLIFGLVNSLRLTSSNNFQPEFENSRESYAASNNDFLKFLDDIYTESREADYPEFDQQDSLWDLSNGFRSQQMQNSDDDYSRIIPDLNLKNNKDYDILYNFLETDNDNSDSSEDPLEDWKDLARNIYPESEEDKEQLLVTALLEDMLDDVIKESRNSWEDITPDSYYEEDDGDEELENDSFPEEAQTLSEDLNEEETLPNSDSKKERDQKQIRDSEEVLDENSEEFQDEEKQENQFREKDQEKSDVERDDVDELRSLLTEIAESEIDKKSVDSNGDIVDSISESGHDNDKEKDSTTTTVAGDNDKKIKINVAVPGVSVSKDDTYLCTGVKISDYTNSTNKPLYIVEYVPHAKQAVAHHMLLYGCKSPGITTPGAVWNCGGVMEGHETNNDGFPRASVCGSNSASTILWAWAKDAPLFKLPKDVGFKIGSGTGIEYLVLQVHYKSAKVFRGGFKDHSAVSVIAVDKPKPRLAGVYILASSLGTVPPHQIKNFDIQCRYKQPFTIHPFAFRTHAHALGVENIGFRIRDAKWTLIGAKSPQLPEAFYPVLNKNMTIRYNDWLAARCVMDNFRNIPTSIGYKHTDEMCNFYIMFWVDAKYEDLLDKWDKQCSNGFPWVHWSSLPGYDN